MFSLTKICEPIYLLTFDDSIELKSHFMRFQEIYESDSKLFNDNYSFELIDYIKWYSKNNRDENQDESFTYFDDWAGFNLPLSIIQQWNAYGYGEPANNCDRFMVSIAEKIVRDCPERTDHYLIGCITGADTTMAHEIAHGLYYTNKKYKTEMLKNISKMSASARRNMITGLKDMGYVESVFDDEIQAYMSTGPLYTVSVSKRTRNPFIKTFNKFKNQLGLKIKDQE